MTVAIGMYGIGGLFVCADSHVVSGDGIVTSGFKMNGAICGNGSFVIGNAGNDGNAATMLAQDILDALTKAKGTLGDAIKKTMKEWHSGYVYNTPPSVQFALAVRAAPQNRALYFCEPPNTIVRKSLDECVVIGIGSQILDPLVPEVIRGPLHLKESLIRAAYLMYRAKKEHAFLKGSDTDALVISEETGEIRQVSREEMKEAEALGPDVDFMLRYCYLGLLGQPQGLSQTNFLESFGETYLKVRKKQTALSSLLLRKASATAGCKNWKAHDRRRECYASSV